MFPALAPNEVETDYVSFYLPSNLSTGTYYLEAYADYNYQVYETSGSDNATQYEEIYVTSAGSSNPDLDARDSGSSAPYLSSNSVTQGYSVTFHYRVSNCGGAGQ